MNILLAEDDQKLGQLILHMLRKEHHTADWVDNGQDALDYADAGDYDLLLLDWMMPRISGIDVCRELRSQGYNKGIIMLTAKDEMQDRIYGLDTGADDYVVKPFTFAELFARIRSVGRRMQSSLAEEVIDLPPYRLDMREHTLSHNQEQIPLTIREYQLLEILMKQPGKTIPRERLYSRIWGLDSDVTFNSLDALIKLLRKKLEQDVGITIRNIRGIGYKLEVGHVQENEK
ncbi:MAG: response regulator transcription factor [Paenibacillaceae bacterium]